jgi:hypothetical protein
LKERLQRHRVAHPNTAITTPAQLEENEGVPVDDLEETDTWFENNGGEVHVFTNSNPGSVGVLDNPAGVECEAIKSELGNRKIRAQFGRRRTHNEQTLVRPCGVICAWATF